MEYENIAKAIPVDTGRKLNVHKKFRRRPGRLLNVLCTFNLRPVSTEIPLAKEELSLQKTNNGGEMKDQLSLWY